MKEKIYQFHFRAEDLDVDQLELMDTRREELKEIGLPEEEVYPITALAMWIHAILHLAEDINLLKSTKDYNLRSALVHTENGGRYSDHTEGIRPRINERYKKNGVISLGKIEDSAIGDIPRVLVKNLDFILVSGDNELPLIPQASLIGVDRRLKLQVWTIARASAIHDEPGSNTRRVDQIITWKEMMEEGGEGIIFKTVPKGVDKINLDLGGTIVFPSQEAGRETSEV